MNKKIIFLMFWFIGIVSGSEQTLLEEAIKITSYKPLESEYLMTENGKCPQMIKGDISLSFDVQISTLYADITDPTYQHAYQNEFFDWFKNDWCSCELITYDGKVKGGIIFEKNSEDVFHMYSVFIEKEFQNDEVRIIVLSKFYQKYKPKKVTVNTCKEDRKNFINIGFSSCFNDLSNALADDAGVLEKKCTKDDFFNRKTNFALQEEQKAPGFFHKWAVLLGVAAIHSDRDVCLGIEKPSRLRSEPSLVLDLIDALVPDLDQEISLREAEILLCGTSIGCVKYSFQEVGRFLTIQCIIVHPWFQKKGIAKQALELLIEQKKPSMTIAQTVLGEAIPFWEKCGFTRSNCNDYQKSNNVFLISNIFEDQEGTEICNNFK